MVNTNPIEPIDVTEYPEFPVEQRRKLTVYDKTLCQDNKPLTDFINKCLLLDHTVEMEKIINGVLLPAYCKADTEYKMSDKFKRVLTKAFRRLVDDPDKKYSYISDVFETLKVHISITTPPKKKRVEFITLSTTVSAKAQNNGRKRLVVGNNNNNIKMSPKKPKLDVIELDCDEEDLSDDSDVMVVDQPKSPANDDNIDNKVIVHNSQTELQISPKAKLTEVVQTNCKENSNSSLNDGPSVATTGRPEAGIYDQLDDDPIEILDSQEIKIKEETQSSNKKYQNHVPNEEDKENVEETDNSMDSENNLLIPRMEIIQFENKELVSVQPENRLTELSEEEKAKRIKQIELKIALYHKKIARLELAEVTDDSEVSPYVKCHRLEARIVTLYQELCELVDAEPAKGRKVRLQVSEGRPGGPIRRVEEFLNMRVDEEGVARFPEYMDVVKCVKRANREDGLGWSEAKILKEAQEIFIYCGRALQKRRQHREYKHMRSRVPRSAFDADPAHGDPELAAKLEHNRQLALKREKELFERQQQSAKEPTSTNLQETVDNTQDPGEESDSEASSDDEPDPVPSNLRTEPMEEPPSASTLIENNDETHNTENPQWDIPIIKQEPVEVLLQYKGDVSLVIEISDSDSSDDESPRPVLNL